MEQDLDIKTIYEILTKQEKSKNRLVNLEEDFYLKCSDLIKKLENELKELSNYEYEDFETYQKLLLKREKALNQVKKIVERIFKLRLRLLINYSYFLADKELGVRIRGLTKEERILLNKLIKEVREYKLSVLKNLLNGKELNYGVEEEKESNKKRVLLAITDYVPQFVGSDFKIYGPFEPEELVNLPEDSAKILISKKKAEKMEE